jgi:poly-gamma-glutamate synthesis protein (capsule biosynthesis protein)
VALSLEETGPAAVFDGVREALAGADHRVANLECVLTRERTGRPGKAVHLRARPEATEALRHGGFDAVTLANNHVMDFGARGLADTLAALDDAGIRSTGAGPDLARAAEPLIFRGEGVSVALIAATGSQGATRREPGFAPLRLRSLRRTIRELRRRVDHVVVSVHWGLEFEPRIVPLHRATGRALVEAGVSLVVGHGPHVLQPVERVGEGWIAFSLGNFVFDHEEPESRRGALLRTEFAPRSVESLELLPVRMDGRGYPRADGPAVSLDLEAGGTIWSPAGGEAVEEKGVQDRFVRDMLDAKRRHGLGSLLWLGLRRGWRLPPSYYPALFGYLLRRLGLRRGGGEAERGDEGGA